MSELTEDRTQRHFDAAFYFHQQQQKENAAQHRLVGASPRNTQHNTLMGGPPAIIIGGLSEERSEAPKLDTIMSAHSLTRPRGEASRNHDVPPPKPQTPRPERDGDSQSVSSMGSRSKLTVAQRARMEADRQSSTPVRVRANSVRSSTTPIRGSISTSRKETTTRLTAGSLSLNNQNNAASSNNSVSGGSFFSTLGKKLERAIDSSILGVGQGASDDDSYESTDIGTDVNTDVNTDINGSRDERRVHKEEKKTGDTDSVVSAVSEKTNNCTLVDPVILC
jgi:hypothetical protein